MWSIWRSVWVSLYSSAESSSYFTCCTRAFDMDWIYGLTSFVTLGLAIYLTVALLKPEFFS